MNVYTFKSREPDHGPRPPAGEPMFNLPRVIIWLGAILIGIHGVRSFVLPAGIDLDLLLYFGFWPVRYTTGVFASGMAPGGLAADIWSFVTYSFLHGGTMHVVFNVLWMAIFGTAVARRFGAGRFLLLSALCAIAGALTHLMTHFGESVPVIGASAAVSGQMAAAIRFIFEYGGPLGSFRRSDAGAYFMPAVSLRQSFSNPQVITFTAVWFGLNLFMGLASAPMAGEGTSIAWQAHIGGFIAGLLLFPVLDPVSRRRG
ncbi:hypothetical protein GCM10011316_34530 [Roseibium aquae]|uniref:Peptidase S54 rhomboid domain-containing protein n=1 Tax=Roseibium aquae TaxID=1323746 RepID=A0A916TMV7_9HYPH|nr:rhomboid family intramembrane serine protease [Roseibium aquae]GGB59610.1 hypothetical protein GCM10011316_34530 [Roseibium aquae]